MTTQTKRILLIVGMTVVTLTIGYAIYYVFFQAFLVPDDTRNDNANTNAGPVTPGGLPNTNVNRPVNANQNVNGEPGVNVNGQTGLPEIADVADGGVTRVTRVSDSSVQHGIASENGTEYVYYDQETGTFVKLFPNGERIQISEQEFFSVADVAWSPGLNQAILSYPDGSNIYYNFDNGTTVTLPKEIGEVEFSETGDKIAYEFLGEDEGERWLAVASPNGSGQQIVEPLGFRDDRVDVTWSPDGQVVGMYREGVGVDQEEIFLIGQHGENFKSFRVDGAGFTGRWTPQGDKLLYSVYNADSGYKPTLHIVDAKGDSIGLNNTSLDVNTWPDKCTFAGTTLYCAVPTGLEDGAGLAPELSRFTPDNFYEINLETGQKSLLAMPYAQSGDEGYSVEDLYVSGDGNSLYFRNALTGTLEQIRIK
ncbi:MAG: hypothetical protein Q8Q20_00850 [bacterium]|nr:hypothetical protein [bacterium]